MNASLLDRLIDLNPENSREPVQNRQMTYNQVKAVVGRDLENLLNTKCFARDIPESRGELSRSIYVYGLSDFTSRNPESPAVRSELRQEIERAIQLFEPRLMKVAVHIEDSDRKEHRLKFRISALLAMNEGSEPVSFDTVFDINRGEYMVPK
jgi:type VI secretion system protein ImpF